MRLLPSFATVASAAATAKAAATFAAANPGTAGFIGGTGAGLVQGKNLKDSLKLGLQVGATTGTLGNVFGTEGLANRSLANCLDLNKPLAAYKVSFLAHLPTSSIWRCIRKRRSHKSSR